jgi:hypothetical protein
MKLGADMPMKTATLLCGQQLQYLAQTCYFCVNTGRTTNRVRFTGSIVARSTDPQSYTWPTTDSPNQGTSARWPSVPKNGPSRSLWRPESHRRLNADSRNEGPQYILTKIRSPSILLEFGTL